MDFSNLKILLMVVLPVGLMIVFMVIASIRASATRKARKQEYEKLSGRAKGVISNFRTEEYRRGHGENETVKYKCFMDYEFEVDGKVYHGKGEGSGALWERKKQMICYDPENPEKNCTKYYFEKMTGTGGMLSAVMCMVIIFIIVAVIFMKFKGISIQDLLSMIGI